MISTLLPRARRHVTRSRTPNAWLTACLGIVGVAGVACSSAGQDEEVFVEPPAASPHAGVLHPDSGATNPTPEPIGFIQSDSGSPPDAQSCAASVSTAKKAAVDIVVAIDTSGSMSDETTQLKANINNFAATVAKSGLDYRVLMIARKGTGGLDVCVPPPLGGPSCGDNPPTFHHFVQSVASTNALSLILQTYEKWKTNLRPEATKVFVVITDDNSQVTSANFDRDLLAKDPAMFGTATKRKYIFDSICGWKEGTPILSSTKCSSAVNTGSVYQELSKLTGGIVDSVCKASYAGVFQNLAQGLSEKLGCEFAVPKSADGAAIDPDKVAVSFTPSEGPGTGTPRPLTRVTDESKCGTFVDGWHYDDNDAPTKIMLCRGACSTVDGDSGGKVEIAAGCATALPR